MGFEFEWKKPDYRKYKIDNISELVKIQEMLKKEGLHDPWLRNYAWRYMLPVRDTKFPYVGRYGAVLKGVVYGFMFGAAFIVVDQIYTLAGGKSSKDNSHH